MSVPGPASRYLAAASTTVRASARPSPPWPKARRTGPSPSDSRTCRHPDRPTRSPSPSHLHQVTPATAKHEQMPGKRVLLQHGLGLRRQGRKALAHVGDARRQPDPRVGGDRHQTDSPRISRDSASGSYPADPHPVPTCKVDLDVVLCNRHRSGHRGFLDDLYRQKAQTHFFRPRTGLGSTLRIAQPFEDQVRIHGVAKRHLRNGNAICMTMFCRCRATRLATNLNCI